MIVGRGHRFSDGRSEGWPWLSAVPGLGPAEGEAPKAQADEGDALAHIQLKVKEQQGSQVLFNIKKITP